MCVVNILILNFGVKYSVSFSSGFTDASYYVQHRKTHTPRNSVSSFHPLIYRRYVLSSYLSIYDFVDTNCGCTSWIASCSVKTERRSSLMRFPDPECYRAHVTVAKTETGKKKKNHERKKSIGAMRLEILHSLLLFSIFKNARNISTIVGKTACFFISVTMSFVYLFIIN